MTSDCRERYDLWAKIDVKVDCLPKTDSQTDGEFLYLSPNDAVSRGSEDSRVLGLPIRRRCVLHSRDRLPVIHCSHILDSRQTIFQKIQSK